LLFECPSITRFVQKIQPIFGQRKPRPHLPKKTMGATCLLHVALPLLAGHVTHFQKPRLDFGKKRDEMPE
jgi:hypothetical protein